MKNSFYTVWLISENEKLQRSFRLTKLGSIVLFFFGIAIIYLAYTGLELVLNRESLNSEIQSLEGMNAHSIRVINDLGGMDLLYEDPSFEKAIITHFSSMPGIAPLSPPVEGYVTLGIVETGGKYEHAGIDIAAKEGESVLASAGGMVLFSGKSSDLGNMVILAHQNGFVTIYGHNQMNFVKAGEIVTHRQVIGKVGVSGLSDGPHLHFEILKDGRTLDPREIMNIYKEKDVSIKQK